MRRHCACALARTDGELRDPEVLDQRDVRRAHERAAAALEAVHQVVVVGHLVEEASFLASSPSCDGLRKIGHASRHEPQRMHGYSRRLDQPAGLALGERDHARSCPWSPGCRGSSTAWPIIGPPRNTRVRSSATPTCIEHEPQWRADRDLVVALLVHAGPADGDDPLLDAAAQRQELADLGGGRDVAADRADLDRQAAGRDLAAEQRCDQHLLRALRVLDLEHFDRRSPSPGGSPRAAPRRRPACWPRPR